MWVGFVQTRAFICKMSHRQWGTPCTPLVTDVPWWNFLINPPLVSTGEGLKYSVNCACGKEASVYLIGQGRAFDAAILAFLCPPESYYKRYIIKVCSYVYRVIRCRKKWEERDWRDGNAAASPSASGSWDNRIVSSHSF